MVRYLLSALGLVLASCGSKGPDSRVTSAPAPKSAVLLVQARDALDGHPIEQVNVVGYRAGRTLSEVTPSGEHIAADGLHRYDQPPFEGSIRFAAPGYSETWSSRVKLVAGETTSIRLSMAPLSRLVVTVVESDGRPVETGTLLLTGPDRESTMSIKHGVAETEDDAGKALIVVDPEFMPGYAPQEMPVVLRSRQRTEVRLEVKRQ